MDEGLAVVIGAVVGAVITGGGGWFVQYLGGQRARCLAKTRKKRLLQMLNGTKYKWRSLDQLSSAVGADESATLELLIEIDARASLANPRSWALVSRAPWPDDMQPEE